MRKMSGKWMALVLAVLLAALPAGMAGAESFVPRLDSGTACTLTVAGHYSNFEALETEFNLFGKYYPDVTLQYVKMDSYNSVIEEALAGDEAPDIFFMYPSMFIDDRYEGLIRQAEDLGDPAAGIDLSCVQPEVLYRTPEGKIPYVPIFGETYGMLVNESIFARQNLAVPETYADLVAACAVLQASGYANPIMGYSKDFLLYPLFFPYFCSRIQGDEEALTHLNAMDASAAGYASEALGLAADFMRYGFFNVALCDEELTKDYEPVILRFFEGDVPMMLMKSSTVSGTAKREAKSEAFTKNPFPYSFHPVPSTDEGGYFLDVISMGFAVNGSGSNLEMANEFMRFLVSNEELNRIANGNRMVPTAREMMPDSIYAPFGKIYPDRIIYQTRLGLEETPDLQVRAAGRLVCRGEMTVDEALAAFGSLK